MKAVHFKPELDITERQKQLKKMCVAQHTKEFQRTLSDSEIDKARHDYVSQAVTLGNVQKNAKAAADSFKAEMSSISTMMEEGLKRIETGKRKVTDTLYSVPNYETGMMEIYDKYGERIDIRKLTPDESTGQMFNNAGEAIHEEEQAATNAVREIGFVPDGDNIQDADFEEVSGHDSETETQEEPVKEEPKKKRKTKAEKEAEAQAQKELENQSEAAQDDEEPPAWEEGESFTEN